MSSPETAISETARRDVAVSVAHSVASPTLDSGKIRMGAGCRIRPLATRTVDSGKIRMGAGCRIRVLTAR